MTLGVILILLGSLIIYAGIKGKSITALLVGDASKPSTPPKGARG